MGASAAEITASNSTNQRSSVGSSLWSLSNLSARLPKLRSYHFRSWTSTGSAMILTTWSPKNAMTTKAATSPQTARTMWVRSSSRCSPNDIELSVKRSVAEGMVAVSASQRKAKSYETAWTNPAGRRRKVRRPKSAPRLHDGGRGRIGCIPPAETARRRRTDASDRTPPVRRRQGEAGFKDEGCRPSSDSTRKARRRSAACRWTARRPGRRLGRGGRRGRRSWGCGATSLVRASP